MSMNRLLIIILSCLMMASAPEVSADRRARTSKSVKQERKATAGEIERTRNQISKNTAETRRQINRLESLNAEVEKQDELVGKLKADITALDIRIKSLDDSIAAMDRDIKVLRESYAENLRIMRERRQTMSSLSFIFSSRSFTEAYKRYRYLQEFEQWQKAKSGQISALAAQISSRRQTVENARNRQAESLARLTMEIDRFNATRSETKTLVAELKRKGSSLKKALTEKQRLLKSLDDELDKIIAEETRQAEEARRKEEARLAEEKRRAEETAREEARKQAQAKTTDQKEKTVATTDTDKKAKPTETQKAATTKTGAETAAHARTIALNGSFASNKGRLPFPVVGQYKITSHFGLNNHRGLSNVRINNSGIDIEVDPSTEARAVFDGDVSSVFRVNGYHNVVMLRHGEYLTVYAGIDALSVKKGDKVKAGQSIGTIFSDPDDDGRSILHFEIRREREKLDPEEWIEHP